MDEFVDVITYLSTLLFVCRQTDPMAMKIYSRYFCKLELDVFVGDFEQSEAHRQE